MSDFCLSCCSTADLTAEHFQERGISYICFHYELDGKEYPDDCGKSMDFETFYRAMDNGADTKTSQVNTGEFEAYFEPFLKEGKDIVHVCLSSGISGVINSANVAKTELEEKYPGRKIYVVDSLGASSGYGLLMDRLADLRDEGMSAQQVYEWAMEHRLNVHHWFFSTDLKFYIKGGQQYRPIRYNIEGDWSGASCLLVAGAVSGEVTIHNLNPLSLQADTAIIDALTRAGAEIITTTDSVTVRKSKLHAFQFDATHCPDLFPALAALAANCEGTSTIRGTHRLTHKESNRAQTIADTFTRMGIQTDIETDDLMQITGGPIHSATVESYNDHRIAMAAAVSALTCDDRITIRNANAVDKSYPEFWDDLDTLSHPV